MTLPEVNPADRLRRSPLAGLITLLGRRYRLRPLAVRMALALEGDMFWSATAREILARRCGVEIGAYSYGDCFIPGAFPRNVSIGRYASIAENVRVFRRNHPLERLSLHPFFYNHRLGFLEADTISGDPMRIEHDAWLGYGCLVLPSARRIGVGAVVGAGAVVTRDIPDFAVAVGNPAKVIRYRFDEPTRARVLASRWWELPIDKVAAHMQSMQLPVSELANTHPLLATVPAETAV